MNTTPLHALLFALVFLTGAAAGYVYENDSWRNDCKTLQKHRDGTSVYKCQLESRETP